MPKDSAAALSVARGVLFFYYEDLPAAVRWYEQVLNCTRVVDLQWSVILRLGDGIQIGLVDATHGTLRPNPEKSAMLALEAPQLERWLERIQQLDPSAIMDGIGVGGHGFIDRFLVRDPGGYIVEFYRWIATPATGPTTP